MPVPAFRLKFWTWACLWLGLLSCSPVLLVALRHPVATSPLDRVAGFSLATNHRLLPPFVTERPRIRDPRSPSASALAVLQGSATRSRCTPTPRASIALQRRSSLLLPCLLLRPSFAGMQKTMARWRISSRVPLHPSALIASRLGPGQVFFS